METTRQQKIARQIQKDIADIFQKAVSYTHLTLPTSDLV